MHLTVGGSVRDVTETARAYNGPGAPLRVTHIVLSAGETPEQLLLTTRIPAHSGVGDEVALMAREIAGAVARASGAVLRRKVELDLSSALPTSLPRGLYLESHIKVQCEQGAIARLSKVASEHSAHLSHNAFRTIDVEFAERFLTRRGPVSDVAGFVRDTAVLVERLRAEPGCEIVKVEEELVIEDTNLALDAGWMKVGGA